jgi:DNA mismatch endonuclease (patch repair protein)
MTKDSEGVAKRMRAIRQRDMAPEMALRKAIHAMGLRYRVDTAPLKSLPRRKADLVFGPARVAVFVDGCFWHGCPEHGNKPRDHGRTRRSPPRGGAGYSDNTS